MPKEEIKGITVGKDEDFSDWYTQVILKAELADYTKVSGCVILRPRAFAVWERVKSWFDVKIKRLGVQNAYFPLFIPEELLAKEASHVEGFSPEVAWVTYGGSSKLNERLAVRPTSETLMYDSYSKWIESYRDLPLRLNQWCNVVRWEFKHPVPFLRTREFLWQEGHTVFADKGGAEKEVRDILELYRQVYEDLLAVPVMLGRKTDSEKFAGAEYTLSVEGFMPNGKAIQAATSHHLGRNFAKAFDISFLNDRGDRELVYQNSWGLSTRSIGIMIMVHGDDKGLVLPPRVSPVDAVIVPILFDATKDKVLEAANNVKSLLDGFNVDLDGREGYSAGWKFNEWEMKGVPVRIEVGPKDVDNKQVVFVRRDSGEKEFVKLADVKKRLPELLDEIQQSLFDRAKKFIGDSTVKVKDWSSFKSAVEDKRLILAQWCEDPECEAQIKDGGVKILNIPFEQDKVSGNCVHCGKPAKLWVRFAKSY